MAGITTASGLPAPFLEPFAEKITEQLATLLPSGPTDVSALAPKVTSVSPFIQQAQQRMATQAGLGALQFSPTTGDVTGIGTGTGVAAYEPYLQAAESLAAPSGYQQFMSPYQQEVISETQRQLDEARARGRAELAPSQIQAGAFGQARGDIAKAEYERQRDITDAGVLANLRQQGLQQAQKLQQQAIANQLGFGEAQEKFESGITSGLGQIGTGAQAYSQSVLDAIRQGNVIAEEFPLQQVQRAVGAFSPLLAGQAGLQTPGAYVGTSPGLAAAQAFGGVFGRVLQSTRGKQNMAPQMHQQPQGFGGTGTGIASLLNF